MTATTGIHGDASDPLLRPVTRTVLFADAVEYSRLVLEDEFGALAFMRNCFGEFRRAAGLHNGTLVKTTGDGVVIEFEDAADALRCAIACQEGLKALNLLRDQRQQARFRIGIHCGEVMHEDGDIYGHSVNVAARLQSFARPEGICISRAARDAVGDRVPVAYRDLGLLQLRNIAGPVPCLRVLLNAADEAEDVATQASDVQLSVLGGVTFHDARGVPVIPRSRKAGAVLGYLALTERLQEFSDRIAELLWSDQPAGKARQSLARALLSLRQLLERAGHGWLDTGGVVRLRLSGGNIDLIALSGELAEGHVNDAFVYGRAKPDHILTGYEREDRAFAAWLKVMRSTWRGRLVKQLERILAAPSPSGEAQQRAALALRHIDPLHEPAVRYLMRDHAAQGNLAAALRLYGDLAGDLRQQFDAAPSTETAALLDRLRQGERLAPSEGLWQGARRGPRLPSVEIGEPTVEDSCNIGPHVLEGFRRELIAGLSRQRDWIIVDTAVTGPAAVREADYTLRLLCGNSHSGPELSLALVDNRTGKHVWADSGALDLERWDQIQFIVIRNISSRLGIYVSVERLAAGLDGEDGSLTAYDQWLQGEHLLDSWAPEAEQEAERLFLGVIEDMPKFAPVYSSLASVYNVQHLINAGSPRDLDQEERAMKLAQTAVDLDPLDTRAHLTLAWSYCMAGQHGRAELHYDLACELAPNNPRTLVSAAQGLAFVNAIGKAVQLADQAIETAPFLTGPQWAYIAAVRFLAGDYAGCVEASTSAAAIVDVAAWEAAAQIQLGRREDARKAARRLLDDVRARWTGSATPDEVEVLAWLLNCYPVRPGPAAERFRDAISAALGLLH